MLALNIEIKSIKLDRKWTDKDMIDFFELKGYLKTPYIPTYLSRELFNEWKKERDEKQTL